MKITLRGADVFLHHKGLPQLPARLGKFSLVFISNRGQKVWPGTYRCELVDAHQCRFEAEGAEGVTLKDLRGLLEEIEAQGFRWVHVEALQEFDGKAAYSKAQGE